MPGRATLKRVLRRVAEGVVSTLSPALWSLEHKPSLLVMMYHRVLPADDPQWAAEQPGMRVSPATLDMQLGLLRRHFVPVFLDDWLAARVAGSALPDRACAVTFDDGWRDNFDHAFPLLQQHAMPATIFLVSDFIGSQYRFWPNRLAEALQSLSGANALSHWPDDLTRAVTAGLAQVPASWPPDEAAIDRIVTECKRVFTDADLYALLDQAAPLPASAPRDLLDWSEITQMADSGLVRFGSHTRRHTRLGKPLAAAVLQDEVAQSRALLERRLGQPVRLFCYPNGERGEAAERLVRASYEGAVLTEPGWNRADVDAFRIRRVGVHEDISATAAAFRSRLSGLP